MSASATVTVTCEIVDRYGFVCDEIVVETPREGGVEAALAEARAQYEADVRNGYEPGSYKADAVIAAVAFARIKGAV